MSSVSNAAYQQAWAKENKETEKHNVTAYLFLGFTWLTCILTLLNGFNILPEWGYNLSTGLCWAMLIVYGIIGGICTIYVPFKLLAAFGFKQQITQKEETAYETYKGLKSSFAKDIAPKSFRQKVLLGLAVIQVVFLFAGGAIITGIVVFCVMLWINILSAISRVVTQNLLKDVITPENISWVEAGQIVDPLTVKVISKENVS